MTKDELELAVSGYKKSIVKFGASWCGPCKMADKMLKKVIDEGFSQVFSVDVEKSPDIGLKFKIMKLPTFIVFQNGEVVERFVDRKTKQEIIDKIK